MKKFISLILALTMVFALATVAFAVESNTAPTDPRDPSEPYDGRQDVAGEITKFYEIKNGTAPAETFKFNFAFVGYKAPGETTFATATVYPTVPGTVDVAFANAVNSNLYVTENFNITAIDNVPLGEYKYTVTEVAGDTAGVTYNTNGMYLVVTILRDENNAKHYVAALHYEGSNGAKFSYVTNSYDAGTLSVKKLIDGNMAEMFDKFTFIVTLTAPTGTKFKGNIGLQVGGTDVTNPTVTTSGSTLTYTIQLGHDETATFTNIPAGTTYTVTEDTTGSVSNMVYVHDAATDESYTDTVATDAEKTISGGDVESVVFTNHKETTVDTGIVLDSMPYVLLMVVAVFGMAMMIRRRSYEN